MCRNGSAEGDEVVVREGTISTWVELKLKIRLGIRRYLGTTWPTEWWETAPKATKFAMVYENGPDLAEKSRIPGSVDGPCTYMKPAYLLIVGEHEIIKS